MTARAPTHCARIHVYPREEILDPQGKAIGDALGRLGFEEVLSVRAGKSFDLELEAGSDQEAELRLTQMCEQLLANTTIEHYSFELLAETTDAAEATTDST